MLSQCKAKVIAHSKSSVSGKEIITFELEFPRIILSEWNTHNALSKNASSSRAIPVPTMLKQVRENPAYPVRFGAANSGMQDRGEHDGLVKIGKYEYQAKTAWGIGALQASLLAEKFHKAGYAKQICNRLIEPFQMMKVVMTATELNNFYWLRVHEAADPTIAELARKIKEAHDASVPEVLEPGEWHTPYYNSGYWKPSTQLLSAPPKAADAFGHTLEHALTISASCCSQVSYRKLDDSIEKARRVVARLNLNGEDPNQPVHASPVEHQNTPIPAECESFKPDTWVDGVTHVDRDGMLCSGNMKGFVQRRQLVANHVKRG